VWNKWPLEMARKSAIHALMSRGSVVLDDEAGRVTGVALRADFDVVADSDGAADALPAPVDPRALPEPEPVDADGAADWAVEAERELVGVQADDVDVEG